MDRDFADVAARGSAPGDWPSSPHTRAGNGGGHVMPAKEGRAGQQADPYLAPAMRAAAAAKARTAQIRSAHPAPERPAPAAPPARLHWVAPVPAPTAPGGSPGVSVAQAATASPIAFRPLRREATEPPYRTEHGPSAPETPAPTEPEPAVEPCRAQNGAARFAKTVAELQRRQGGDEPAERWAQMVPRPAGPRRDEPAAEARSGVRPSSLGRLWRYLRGSGSGPEPTG